MDGGRGSAEEKKCAIDIEREEGGNKRWRGRRNNGRVDDDGTL